MSPNPRDSITSRVSHFFGRRQAQTPSLDPSSHRTSGACEVPIFISPSSDHLEFRHDDIEAIPAGLHCGRPYNNYSHTRTVPASSIYSGSPDLQAQHDFMDQIDEVSRPSTPDTTRDLEAGTSVTSHTASETQLIREKRRRRRRVCETRREKIAGKKRLGMAFGVTTLAAVITYTVLAVSGKGTGIMFHVLSLVFILVLMGVFLHSAVRLIMLQRRRRARLARHRDWHGSQSRSGTSSSSQGRSQRSRSPCADHMSEKDIPVLVGGEEIVTTTPRGKNIKIIRPPPPVYGNFRESKQIQPEMLFWQDQDPSPTTPTYEEALKDVQTAVGYQPPQYISPKREREAVRTGQRVSDIHPLERVRVVGLMGNTMSSQR